MVFTTTTLQTSPTENEFAFWVTVLGIVVVAVLCGLFWCIKGMCTGRNTDPSHERYFE
jgi:hypothetical protein